MDAERWRVLARVGIEVRDGARRLVLVPRWRAAGAEGAVPATIAATLVGRWLDHPFADAALRRLTSELGVHPDTTMGPAQLRGAMRSALEAAVSQGTLLVFARALDVGFGPSPTSSADDSSSASAPTPSAGDRDPVQEKTWIELRLVDSDDQPMVGARYRIVLPDNETREGTLGADGGARLENLDPGSCDVCFPDIDGAEWGSA